MLSGVLSISVVKSASPFSSTGLSSLISAQFTAVPNNAPLTVKVIGILSFAPVLNNPLRAHQSYVAISPVLFNVQSGSESVNHVGI